jgi:hypothetical protein
VGAVSSFIPIVADVIAAVVAPELAPAIGPLGATLAGAAIGAGGGALGDVAGGKPVSPLDVGLGAAGGAGGAFLGSGGLGDIASAIGLGGAPGAITTAPGVAEGVTAAETASPFAAGPGAAGPIAGSVGQTAAGAAAVDPLAIGATTPTSVLPTDLAGSVTGANIAPTSNVFSALGSAYKAAKPALDVAGTANTLYGLAQKVLGPQQGPAMGGAYTTPQPSMYAGAAGPAARGYGADILGGAGTQYNPNTGQRYNVATGQVVPQGTMSSPSGMWS